MRFDIYVDSTDLGGAIIGIKDIEKNISRRVESALMEWGTEALDRMRELVSGEMLNRQTGRLYNSILTVPEHPSKLEVEIGFNSVDAPHGLLYVYGRRGGWAIAAKNVKVLHFQIGGKPVSFTTKAGKAVNFIRDKDDVFTKEVWHPSVRKKDFVDQAARDKLQRLRTALRVAVSNQPE